MDRSPAYYDPTLLLLLLLLYMLCYYVLIYIVLMVLELLGGKNKKPWHNILSSSLRPGAEIVQSPLLPQICKWT